MRRGGWKEGERKTPQETLNDREQTEADEGRWVGDGLRLVMGIKEGSCDEDWELYVSDESLNSAETNTALHVG